MKGIDEIPDGYRQAATTAMTVFLGFSLTFMRLFRNVVAKNGWTSPAVIAELIIGLGVLVQTATLFRGLDVRDNELKRYQKTIWLFKASVITVLGGVVVSVLAVS